MGQQAQGLFVLYPCAAMVSCARISVHHACTHWTQQLPLPVRNSAIRIGSQANASAATHQRTK